MVFLKNSQPSQPLFFGEGVLEVEIASRFSPGGSGSLEAPMVDQGC